MTIFIIAAILIVGIIASFFMFKKMIPEIGQRKEVNPNLFLKTCIEDKVEEAIDLVSIKGGYINPPLYKKFRFSDEVSFHNISYLCYNRNYREPCINQQPMLIKHIKDEIKNYIKEDMILCFDNLVLSLEKQNYVVEPIYRGIDVELFPGRVTINLDSELDLSFGDESSNFKGFSLSISSRLYELANLAQEIVSQESKYCYFEWIGYMLLYPEVKIDKFRVEDGTNIYTLDYKETKERFRFAVKGCTSPPGLF